MAPSGRQCAKRGTGVISSPPPAGSEEPARTVLPGAMAEVQLPSPFLPPLCNASFQCIMANSNGNPELQGLVQTAQPSPSKVHGEDLTAATSQKPLPRKKRQNKSKRKKRDSYGTKRRKETGTGSRDGWVDEIAGAVNEQSPLSPMPRISLKSLVEVEMKLVYGDEQNITHKLAQSPATTSSQLMCQSSETVGPPSGPNLGFLPQIDKWLDVALQDANAHYRLKKYAIAASHFAAALELCSKGSVLGEPFSADYEDISKVVSFLESKLVACFLRMHRPDLALLHSYRSIQLNPTNFQDHLQQAMVYRLLGNPCGAARSAMIADYVYWLSGDGEPHISKLIKLYWQGLLEVAITMEEGFSVLYTPCCGKPTRDITLQTEETFRKLHPAFTAYIFTDLHGVHMLPQTTDWSRSSTHSYILTLGFRKSQDGDFLEKLLHRKCPTFTGPQAPFTPPTPEQLHRMYETLGRRILPVLDFIKCTKIAAGFSTGSGLIERLQYADCLVQLRRVKEHGEVLQHTLAELALAPYLQKISPADMTLLQALMADTMDTLEGKRPDQERVWNAMQKVGLIEDMLYQWEETYLKNTALGVAKKEKAKERNALQEPKKGSSKEPVLQGVPQAQPQTDPSFREHRSLSSPYTTLSPPPALRTPDTATHLQREPPAAPITPH
ncbi:spermatogenesis-associated protein 16-like [Salminus brasiliensis]|uniref:spermatogenesis-associated protein 16-like n=1 Tax=Salminus brasiliensis TaxID=930266 RepID=UPI003B833D2A